MKCNIEIMKCHPDWETDSLKGFFVLEYDEEFCVRKEYVYKKGKNKVDNGTYTNREEIILSENT